MARCPLAMRLNAMDAAIKKVALGVASGRVTIGVSAAGYISGDAKVDVTDFDHPPTEISLSASTVAENATGATIGAVTVPDANNTHTFVVSINLDITATDAGDLDVTKSFTINVTNVNEAPTALSLTNVAAKENTPGIVIGQLSVTDEDAGDTHTLTVSHCDFELDGGMLRLKEGRSLSYDESNPTITVPVTAIDSGGLSYTEQFAIIVLAHPLPWQNDANAADANADGSVSPSMLWSSSITSTIAGRECYPFRRRPPSFSITTPTAMLRSRQLMR